LSVLFANKIKAAVAYCLELPKKKDFEPNNFAWSVGGFRALCEIKANAVMARSPSDLPTRTMIEDVNFIDILLTSDVHVLENELGIFKMGKD
jgi:hypothetical protein